MVNKRSFLLGLGLGVIIGALLLQLFSLGEESQRNLETIGLEMERDGLPQSTPAASPSPPQADEPESPVQSESAEQDANSAENEGSVAVEEEEDAEALLSTPAPSPTATAIVVEETHQTDPPVKDIMIRIEPGATLGSAAKRLASAGILASAESFEKEMKAQNKVVRAGYFLFPDATLDNKEVVKIITGIPLSEQETKEKEALLWSGP